MSSKVLLRLGTQLPTKWKVLQRVAHMSSVADGYKITGFCCPPVTPFRKNGEVNLDMTAKYVQHFVDFKCPNAYVLGTTGEAANLSLPERKAIVESWITEGKNKLSQVIVQVGAGNLPDSQELANHAQENGADAIACIGPTFFKAETFESYLSYMSEVASAAPKLPFILYDFQGLTGIPYDVGDFFAAAKTRLPNLAGVKYTTTDMAQLHNFHTMYPHTNLLMGNDELYLHGLGLGITGNTIQSYMGNVLSKMRTAFEKKEMEAVKLEQSRALQMCNIRRKHGLSIPGATKSILLAMDMEVGDPRLPLAAISKLVVQAVRQEMEDIGFFQWAY